MNITEAKQIDLVEFLTRKGIRAHHRRGNTHWYHSPYREDRTPSFKIDTLRNEWYDFGTGEGGDIIDLGKKLYSTGNIPDVLRNIAADVPILVTHLTRKKEERRPAENELHDIEYGPLRELPLQSYIIRRKVDLNIARVYCCEVHYSLRSRNYYAIAFRNRQGGFEIRNQYFKGCIGHKDITFIPEEKDTLQQTCCIFEGFMDFLSYLTIRQQQGNTFEDITDKSDMIVLNTVTCLHRAMDLLQHYNHIHCFLDNDEAGRRTTQTITNSYPDKTIDESHRYHDYDDLNDYLIKISECDRPE